MKTTHCLFAAWVAAQAALLAAEPEEGFKSIFNGKDLSGWEGNPKLWSVKDGAITGQTTRENPARGNTFLIWKAEDLVEHLAVLARHADNRLDARAVSAQLSNDRSHLDGFRASPEDGQDFQSQNLAVAWMGFQFS